MRFDRFSMLIAIAVLVGLPAASFAQTRPPVPAQRPLSAGAQAFNNSQRAQGLRARGWLTGTRGGLVRSGSPWAAGSRLGAPSGPNASTVFSRTGVDQYNVREGDRTLRFRFVRPTTTAAPIRLTVGRTVMPVRVVMFDIDGTLVDTRQTIADGIRAGLRSLNLPEHEDFVAEQTRGRAYSDVAADAVHRYSTALAAHEPGGQLSPAREGALRQQFITEAARVTETAERAGRATAYNGAVRLINDLRARGIGVVAVTSRPTRSAQELLERNGMGNQFDVIVGRQQAWGGRPAEVIVRNQVRPGTPMAGKPAPSSVLYGLRLLGRAHPSQTVYVGDMHTDLRAAAGAGVGTIGIGHGMDTPETLRAENPTAYVDNIAQLRAAFGLPAETPAARR